MSICLQSWAIRLYIVVSVTASVSRGWDVIVLQEVWHARERDALRRAALLAGLRYSRHYEPGCGAPVLGPGSGGTGLLVLSRYPIAESFFWVRFWELEVGFWVRKTGGTLTRPVFRTSWFECAAYSTVLELGCLCSHHFPTL